MGALGNRTPTLIGEPGTELFEAVLEAWYDVWETKSPALRAQMLKRVARIHDQLHNCDPHDKDEVMMRDAWAAFYKKIVGGTQRA